MIKKFFKKFFKRTPATRMLFFIVNDLILIPLAIYLSFLLRFEGQIPEQYNLAIQVMFLLSLGSSVPVFYFNRLYSFSWSYVSTEELVSLIKATVLSFSFIGAVLFIFRDHDIFSGFPRSTLLMSFFFMILFCGGIRFLKRIYLQIFYKRLKKSAGKEKTLIIGAGDAGEQILRSILSSESGLFYPIGFVDDNLVKQGVAIHGLKVLGRIKDIPKIVEENQVKAMIIALPSAGSEVIKKAVEKGRQAGIRKIKVIPLLTEIVDSQVSIRNLKDLKIEDLLGRKPISLDLDSLEKFINEKRILITGAAGSIGSELSRQVAKFKPSSLILLDQDETGIFDITKELKYSFSNLSIFPEICDIRDKEKIDYIFNKIKPEIIFHAAAYKHVPLMETHFDEAVKNNIFGTEIVAEAALKYKVEKFVFISTDKAVNPTSVMGTTKRIGELVCRKLNDKNSTKFISVRFGNVLDSRGSVIPIFKEQIRNGGPVEVTHPDMKRYFMMIPEACLLVMEAAEMGDGGEVFVLNMGDPIKILDLAKEMIRLSGFKPDEDIPIIFTEPRPGEKLFEELLTAEEGTIATKQKKIFTAKLSNINEQELNIDLEKIKEAIKEQNREKLIEIFKKIVPYFHPSD